MVKDLIVPAQQLVNRLIEQGKKVTLAESCTGGWVAQTITAIAGSSQCFEYGFVTYSNSAKTQLLAVRRDTLIKFGAVSNETVEEMLLGALRISGADLAIAVSGIAGPDGGSALKPVGTVYIGVCDKANNMQIQRFLFHGKRQQIRHETVVKALQLAIAQI